MVPKAKWETLELSNGSLHDLIPGKVYAINVNTLDTFMDPFDSLREM